MCRNWLLVLGAVLARAGTSEARGLLIPVERRCRPWRCSTTGPDRHRRSGGHHPRRTNLPQPHRSPTRATYVFPCPRAPRSTSSPCGSATGSQRRARRGQEAREIYTAIVRRTQDPACSNTWQQPAPPPRLPHPGPRRPEGLSLLQRRRRQEGKLIEYVYPLKTDGLAVSTLESSASPRR